MMPLPTPKDYPYANKPRLLTDSGVALWLLIILLCTVGFTVLHAQSDVPGDPSGASGDFDGLSTTGSGYDTYTGNSKRTITDVVVPGAAGSFPLRFTRIYNARVNVVPSSIGAHFGDANWRHNYQWEGRVSSSGSTTVYQVGYPDGRVINFQMNRAHQVADSFARGPAPTADRFDPTPDGNGFYHLHLADGSQVTLSLQADSNGNATLFRAEQLIDPFGAITTLSYITYHTSVGNQTVQVLRQIKEPGGRSLFLSYGTQSFYNSANNTLYYWAVISGVFWYDTANVIHNDASYGYYVYGPGQANELAQTTIYCALKSVVYSQPQHDNPQAFVTANYTYQAVDNPGTLGTAPPLLLTADDPFFVGPMHRIEYSYATGAGVWGLVQEERNPTNHVMVSSLTQDQPNTPNSATESRGDYTDSSKSQHVKRVFNYGEGSAGGLSTNARQFQVTTATDFQGNAAYTAYNPKDSSSGWGYVAQVIDAAQTTTSYITEPYAGKVTKVTLPGGRTHSFTWAGIDSATNYQQLTAKYPYFVTSKTDERLQTTNYYRHANTGLIYQIHYPDGSNEYFDYTQFNRGNIVYFKIFHYYNKLGAQFTFNYGQNDNGQGQADLLKSVTRTYTDAITPTFSHSDTITYTYDQTNRVNSVQDERGVIERFTYNPRGQVTRVTHDVTSTQSQPNFDSSHNHVDYDYDDDGNFVGVTDELSHKTTIIYDSYRRVVSVTVPVNAPQANSGWIGSRTRSFSYTRRDNAERSLGGAVTDTASHWSVSWLPSGAAVARIYSPNYWLTDEFDGMRVDGSPNPVPVPGNGAVHSSVAYNVLGQPLSTLTGDPYPTSDGHHFATTYTYDAYNRPSTISDPLGGPNHTTTRTYYANAEPASNGSGMNCTGLLKSVNVPGPDLSIYPTVLNQYTNYDQMGRLLASIDPVGYNTNSGYDAAGNLSSQNDGAQASGGHTTGYSSDQLGRKSQITYPDGTTEQWTYDKSGNVSSFKNRANKTCNYWYLDGRNRCTSYVWSDVSTSSANYSYYGNGLLKVASNNNSGIQYTYDDSNALIIESEQITGPSWKTTRYTHDADGLVDSITYPNGNYPCFTHDDQGRVTSMYSGTTTFSAYYYSGDRLVGRALYNGFYTGYDYQNNGRVWDVWHVDGTHNRNISRHCYGYAPNGQISWFDREPDTGNPYLPSSNSVLENGRGDVYYYWPDGSVRTAARDVAANGGWPNLGSTTADSRVAEGNVNYANGSANTYCNNYYYDAAGNRTQATQMNQGTIPYGADGSNRYYGSSYDGNGNTSDSVVGWTYTYDAENKMIGASGPSGQTLQFAYDVAGRMIKQVTNGAVSYFSYAGAQRIEEYNANNSVVYLYFYDAPGSDQILFRQGGPWGRLWYQTDLMGNTTHLSAEQFNTQGQITGGYVVEQYLYDAYGTPTVYDAFGTQLSVSQFDNRYLFKSNGGYVWYPQAGLYYCRARFYLPQHGRFLQPDPIGQAGGLNIYGYCSNDPINTMDPSGLEFVIIGYVPQYFTFYDPSTGGLESWLIGYTPIYADIGVVPSGGNGGNGGGGNGGKSGGNGGGTTGAVPPTPPPTPHFVARGGDVFGSVGEANRRTGGLPADEFNQVPKALYLEVGGGLAIEAAGASTWIAARGAAVTRIATGVYTRAIAAIYTLLKIPGIEEKTEELEGVAETAPNTVRTLATATPPNMGFLGTPYRMVLSVGQRIDRYGGSEISRFFSPVGTSMMARAMPSLTAAGPLRTFEVLVPFEVQIGTAAPFYNQIGMGPQILTPLPLGSLLQLGYLLEVQ